MTADTIKLGNRVKDLVSGVEGIVTGRTEFLNGCVQFIIKPPVDKDGKQQDSHWIDWQQLEILDAGIAEQVAQRRYANPTRTGGPSPRDTVPQPRPPR